MAKEVWGSPVAPQKDETKTLEGTPEIIDVHPGETTGFSEDVASAIQDVKAIEQIAEIASNLIRMWRDPSGPTPHEANVHPTEVGSWSQAGWNVFKNDGSDS